MSGTTRQDFGKVRKTASQAEYKADAALKHIAQLEAWASAFSGMSFMRRMKWLLLGK